ncbi:hypothetical protein KBTX_04114 [wastewater metagenome]|uniref:YGGT family n=2 Tax=unclassified sequences TaxID=12908 RepID=A0A5B8RGI5_9ZZZZ|nr:hypothetical protein KBTEX_04114 [uncultured organism]
MTRSFLGKLINIIVEIIESILGIHILLKLFRANPDVPFVRWMFDLSAPILRPFRGIFDNMVFQDKYVLDLSALFALIIYGIVGYLVLLLISTVERGRKRRR